MNSTLNNFTTFCPQNTGSRKKTKQDCINSFLIKLQERGDVDIGAHGFVDSVCTHFDSLPTRYALDVNTDSLDVLNHKRLLEEARGDPSSVSFHVRPVEVLLSKQFEGSVLASTRYHRRGALPKPAFGSSPNLQACLISRPRAVLPC